MKLFYSCCHNGFSGITNFGDYLNSWLWDKLLPDMFDEDNKTIFIAIGTLLNNYVPKADRTVVFGSGVGYGEGLPKVDESWKIYCLRGPLSARKLSVAPDLAVTDAAVLVRRIYKHIPGKINRFAYMPHIEHAIVADSVWKTICEQAGIVYIDPRWSIEQVLSVISHTEVLLTEAMHGAIVADALRVPWIPIFTSTRIYPFKWHDWCLSIDVEYQPKYIMPIRKLYPPGSGILHSLYHWKNCLTQDPKRLLKSLYQKKFTKVVSQLADIAKTSKPILSRDNRIEELTVQLEERLQHFQKDVAAGHFHHSNKN